MDVKKRVERYVLDRGGDKDIWAPTVYSAKPDVKMIFSIPFNANYERHLGPVLGLSCSLFVKRLFLSCSSLTPLFLFYRTPTDTRRAGRLPVHGGDGR